MVTHVTDILAAMRTAHNLCDRGRVVYKTLSSCSRPRRPRFEAFTTDTKIIGSWTPLFRWQCDGSVTVFGRRLPGG